ncbi:hypothetical protein IT087_03225 [Candidatus Uhrbacteria bacterium]|nr:hypothetical protein [Candidatus Uhrbacteria bacterium]
MVERNLLQAGLEVRCPKCSLKTWINLKEIREIYICEYCEESSKFVESVEPITIKCGDELKRIDGVRWHYRLSGLVGKKDKQQGAVPVILTLQYFANRMHNSHLGGGFRSTGLNLEYEENGERKHTETDLLLFEMNRGRKNLEILIGECKTGQPITDDQINKLVAIKRLLEKSGVTCHLVFAKTKGEFSTGEINRFKRLTQQGIQPLLFTSNELERWSNEYKNFKAQRPDFKLPIEYPLTFEEIAQNSAYTYRLA